MPVIFLFASNSPLTIVPSFNTCGTRRSALSFNSSDAIQSANGKKQITLCDITPARDFNYLADTCTGCFAKVIDEMRYICCNSETSHGEALIIIREMLSIKIITAGGGRAAEG